MHSAMNSSAGFTGTTTTTAFAAPVPAPSQQQSASQQSQQGSEAGAAGPSTPPAADGPHAGPVSQHQGRCCLLNVYVADGCPVYHNTHRENGAQDMHSVPLNVGSWVSIHLLQSILVFAMRRPARLAAAAEAQKGMCDVWHDGRSCTLTLHSGHQNYTHAPLAQ